MPEITKVKAYSLELPLEGAFETAQGRKTRSPQVIVELHLSDGVTGLGAATPVKYVTGEDTASVLSAVEICARDLQGTDPSAYRLLFQILTDVLPEDPSARAALETAVLDAFCKLHGLPMCRFFGGAADGVETDVTIPLVDPETARELAQRAASQGFNYLKVKVGGEDPDEDLARILAIGECVPQCSIRLDANQAFVPTVAVGFISRLQAAGVKLDMVEQPVERTDLDGLRYVTQHTSVPVFADESVLTPADAFRLLELEAADGINVKIMKSGISGALDIIALCRAARKQLMLGCMLESGISLSAAVHLACGTGSFDRLDLDAHLLVADQPFTGGFSADGSLLRADLGSTGHGSMETGQTHTATTL